MPAGLGLYSPSRRAGSSYSVQPGSLAAPGVRPAGYASGIYWPASEQVALGMNGAVAFIMDGNTTPAGPRSYIVDAAGTKSVMTLTRGTSTSVGSYADLSYTGALMVDSFNNGGRGIPTYNEPIDRGGSAISGRGYAVQGTGGFHAGVTGTAESPLAGSWACGSGGLIGLFGQALSYKVAGRTWGMNVIARGMAGDQGAIVGGEIGVSNEAGIAVQERYGLQIVTLSTGTNFGTQDDIALKFADKTNNAGSPVVGNQWRVGIGFGSSGVTGALGFPVVSTGTLIKSYGTGTFANGIDFSTNVISDAAFKSPEFTVLGNGRVAINTSSTTTEAPLFIDATGEAYALRIDGFTIQPTAGASAGYLELRRGSTTYKLQIYANA